MRHALGLTQEQMAKKLGLSTRALGRYELGQRRITKILIIAARCLAYHQAGA